MGFRFRGLGFRFRGLGFTGFGLGEHGLQAWVEGSEITVSRPFPGSPSLRIQLGKPVFRNKELCWVLLCSSLVYLRSGEVTASGIRVWWCFLACSFNTETCGRNTLNCFAVGEEAAPDPTNQGDSDDSDVPNGTTLTDFSGLKRETGGTTFPRASR